MKSKILFAVSLLFGLMMVNAGLNKFLHYMPVPEMNEAAGSLMGAFAASGWLIPLIAIVEIIAGVLFIIPRFRALGAVMILPITIGIFLFHVVLDPGTVVISFVLLLINAIVIWDNKEKYMPMIRA